MVLVSEAVVASTTFCAVVIVIPNAISILLREWKPRSRMASRAVFMLVGYSAVRLLLETEAKQSVGPVYSAAVMLFFVNLSRGRRAKLHWILRIFNALVNVYAVMGYLILFRLRDVEKSADVVALDREVT